MNGFKTGIGNQVQKTAKAAAIKSAQQMRDEILEIPKNIPPQILGIEKPSGGGNQNFSPGPEKQENEETRKHEAKDHALKMKFLNAHEAELAEIKNRKKQESMLKQQQENAIVQDADEAKANKGPLIEPTAKRKRGIFTKIKAKIGELQPERLKRKTENRMPPSG